MKKTIKLAFFLTFLTSLVNAVELPPLLKAAQNCDTAAARSLLSSGEATVEMEDERGWTALHHIAAGSRFSHGQDRTPFATMLVEEFGANVRKKADTGFTPLHVAAYCGELGLAGFLLDHGAVLEEGDNEGDTPLHRAAEMGRKEAVTFLLSRGARRDASNGAGRVPLDLTSIASIRALLE